MVSCLETKNLVKNFVYKYLDIVDPLPLLKPGLEYLGVLIIIESKSGALALAC